MAWQPQDEPLRQLAKFLSDSLNGSNRAVQKHAEQVGSLSSLLCLRLTSRVLNPNSIKLTSIVVDACASNLIAGFC